MFNLEDLRHAVDVGEIHTVVLGFTDHYGRMMGKRFEASFFVDNVAKHGTHACDYLLTVDMEMEPVPGYRFANWEKGYGDFHLAPDLATVRRADWLDGTALVLCDVKSDSTQELVAPAPRSILRKQLEAASGQGYAVNAGSEVEYYIFRNSYADSAESAYANMKPAGWYIEDYHTLQAQREEELNAAVRNHLVRSNVPVECTKGEWGKGQHELNLRYCDCLEMADRHIIYKQCIKEMADRLGISVTFMAKFSEQSAGSSCHIHVSLWCDAASAFTGDSQLGSVRCSNEFRWFLGGWMAHARDMMVLYAPTVNSYKRFQVGSWAPTGLAWSYDNRTAGFRVVGRGESLRIECRIPGADCNPYLAYAAAVASGLDGIANQTEPPSAYDGNVYAATDVPHVPRSLREATDCFAKSKLAHEAFGSDVVEHYTHFFDTEQKAYDKAVTDWERKRYFEQI